MVIVPVLKKYMIVHSNSWGQSFTYAVFFFSSNVLKTIMHFALLTILQFVKALQPVPVFRFNDFIF